MPPTLVLLVDVTLVDPKIDHGSLLRIAPMSVTIASASGSCSCSTLCHRS